MRVELLRVTEDGINLIANAARVTRELPGKDATDIVGLVVRNDYSSVLEHVSFTFDISGISIALSRWLLEHRMASHTARSTQYNEEDEFDYYLPDPGEVPNRRLIITEFLDAMNDAKIHYRALRTRGVSRELARYVLPMSAHTRYVLTMNCRSLINFFSLRLCVRAAPEMRTLAEKMYDYCYAEYPEIFEQVGCRGVTNGVCPENGVRPDNCPHKHIPTKAEVQHETLAAIEAEAE